MVVCYSSPNKWRHGLVWTLGRAGAEGQHGRIAVGGAHGEGTIAGWPKSWTWAIRGSCPSLCLECMFALPSPHEEPFRGCNLERAVRVRPYEWHTRLKTVKASIWTFKILTGRGGDLLILWLPTTSLRCKFPCLLNLSPTNLELSASLRSLLATCVLGPV